MRELVLVMVVLAVWCEAAFAKPKVAILGLEVVVSGEKADPKDLQIAASLNDSLRALPRSGAGRFELAPSSDRELIDEKLAGSCLTENLYCMAPIGLGLGADYLVYGNLVKATETEQDGYQVSLKLLDVNARPPKLEEIAETFVPASTLKGNPDGAEAWAQQIYARLTGDEANQARLAVNANVKRGDVLVDEAQQGRPTASSLTLDKGKLLIAGSTISLDISNRDDPVLDPSQLVSFVPYKDPLLLSFAPSVWYGVNDELTIGLTHDFGTTLWTPRPTFLTLFTTRDDQSRDSVLGAGLCVTVLEGDGGCPASYKTSRYNSAGADILYSLKQGRLSLAAHPGIDATVRYPFTIDIRIGVLGRMMVNEKLSLVFEPRLRFGDLDGCSGRSCDGSNHNIVELPVWTWIHINRIVSVYLHIALNSINGTFEGIPLQFGGNCQITQRLMFGLDFGFRNVNDNDKNSNTVNSFEGRALGLRVIYTP